MELFSEFGGGLSMSTAGPSFVQLFPPLNLPPHQDPTLA